MTISQCIEREVSAAGTIDCRAIALLTGHPLLSVMIVARAMGYQEVDANLRIFQYRDEIRDNGQHYVCRVWNCDSPKGIY